ncbi:hypothetical protein O9G_004097 [Rozella allomycis CSF55]|uniref:MACPF domain-containing protein n=1 Tax=Rozella allomycis (strain CSF55) TaxID=988480 RepID=A0A075ARA8_ROZAC|nr:hypothetical protein O9G_004097 [Rozella allomycis CSF55]|eukprot:EPZ32826.1 hypothetical protein O9G_004097 [Rozella allomycis CSF55]
MQKFIFSSGVKIFYPGMLKIFICCIFLVQVALGQVLRIVSDSLHEAKRLAVEDAPTDQAPSQPESPKVVYDAIPGTMFVGSGYDASKQYGTFENMRHDLIIKQGGDVSPDKIFNEKYLVPSNVDAFGIWKTFAETNSFSSEAEFISSLGNRVAGEGGGSCFGINVEASASFSSKKDKSSKELKKTIVFETRVELFELVLQPNSLQENVAPVFKDLIKVALDKYNETKDAGVSERIKKMYEYYYYFFDACGTHYVKSAVLGGHLFIKIEASVQDQSEMNKIEAAASAYVSGLWGGGGASTSYSDESGEKKLQEKSFGGDPLSGLVVNADNDMKTAFEFWLQTVPDKPNIARFTIDPIYNLLDKDSQVLYSDMKIAYEMYLKRVPPKGDNYFDLLPYVPSVWSSSNVLTTPGNGLITFDAVVSDSFSVQFATLPQSPVLKINFDVYKGCSFQIFQEQKNSITGILDLVVPKSVLTSFWIQLENGENLYVGFGNPPGHGSKPLYSKRNLASYRDLLSKVEFVGFTSSGSRATSLIGLNIQEPAHIYQKQFQTCQDYMNDHPSERGGLKTLIWHGFPVQIYCYKDNNDWKEYLELLVSATGVYKNIQNDFRYIRILPEYMALDLCDTKMSTDTAGYPGVFDAKKLNVDTNASASITLPPSFAFHEFANNMVGQGDIQSFVFQISDNNNVLSIKSNGDIEEAEIWYGNPSLSYSIPDLETCQTDIGHPHKVLVVYLRQIMDVTDNPFRTSYGMPPVCPGGSFQIPVEAATAIKDESSINVTYNDAAIELDNLQDISLVYLVDFPYSSKYWIGLDIENFKGEVNAVLIDGISVLDHPLNEENKHFLIHHMHLMTEDEIAVFNGFILSTVISIDDENK